MNAREEKKPRSYSPRPFIIFGYAVILLAFGVFGTWAATAKLASGVVANGTVSPIGNRKTVQHLEGGIVSEILVREGDIVSAGDILVRLDETQARANFAVLQSRLRFALAAATRLEAEASNAAELDFPDDLFASDVDKEVPAYIAVQRTLFEERRATRDGQTSILRTRIRQLEEELIGLEAQQTSYSEQAGSLGEQIDRMSEGERAGVVASNQLSQLTRSKMEIDGDLGQVIANIARVKQSVAETELQILQINQEYSERASTELREVRDQVSELTERVEQAKDVLDRTIVRAPENGMVQDIQFHTQTGVVRAAEPILDIIPLDDDLIINARVRPVDIDNVHIGNVAEVRFPAFSSSTTPVMFGSVQVLSQDVILPEDPRAEPYYMARIEVPDEEIADQIRGRLMPGMPSQVVFVGTERTLVQYLVKPLADAFSKGMLEE